ncbi:MAG: alpha/beta hydrolase [Proteobacteria bacterium]|nr:alpha/beta hydrolase [Pseudomonadota bacterium]
MTARRVPVVMIHGAFCGAWAFADWAPIFENQGFAVHVPDLRFHDCGKHPPRALGTTSLTDYADDLEKLLKTIGEPAFLIGHSMGGLLAQMLAARGKVRGIACLAPSAPYGILPSTPFEIASAQALYMAGEFWNKPLKPERWIAMTNALDRLDEAAREKVFARFVPESGLATFEIMQWALDPRRASSVDATRVDCPVLCLAGKRDRVNPPATVRGVAKRYRAKGSFEEIPGHSHWLIGEPGWEKIAGRVLEFFADAAAETRTAS